jgi:hypothetical protein
LVYQFIIEKNFCIVPKKILHYCTKVFSPSGFVSANFYYTSIRFSFHSCSIITINNQNVFMNGMREDGELGEEYPLSMSDYGVGISET